MSSDIFGHVKKTHEDLSKPSSHHKPMDRIGWGLDNDTFAPVDGVKAEPLNHEMLETLTILDAEDDFLLSADNTLAQAYGDMIALDFNERKARSSIAIKGKGREDAKAIIGGVKQSVSVPTQLSKVRKILTGGDGKKRNGEMEEHEIAEYESE